MVDKRIRINIKKYITCFKLEWLCSILPQHIFNLILSTKALKCRCSKKATNWNMISLNYTLHCEHKVQVWHSYLEYTHYSYYKGIVRQKTLQQNKPQTWIIIDKYWLEHNLRLGHKIPNWLVQWLMWVSHQDICTWNILLKHHVWHRF
jgi:hypothetical protein